MDGPLFARPTIDSILQNFFFPEALTKKSKTNAYMGHLLQNVKRTSFNY